MRRTRAALIALAAAAAAILAIGSLTAGAQAPPELPTTFPEAPRVVGGGDPLAKVPGPVECAPERATGPRPYFRLAQLPRRRARSPFAAGPGIVSYELDLTNRKSQRFQVYVSAASNTGALRYIQRASMCLERFTYLDQLPDQVDPVRYDDLLVVAAGQVAQLTAAQLVALRAAQGSDSSFTELLEAGGADPVAVIDAAAALATSQLAAKVVAGELTAAEVAAVDVRQQIDDLARAPASGFPSDPAESSVSPLVKGRRLRADPRNGVVIGMVERGAKSRPSVIWYAVDPPLAGPFAINKFPPGHNYTAKCTTSAWTQIQATANSAWVKLKRSGSEVGRRFDSASTFGASATLSRSSSTNRTYDIYVWSNWNNSEYSVFGGWTRGGGGVC